MWILSLVFEGEKIKFKFGICIKVEYFEYLYVFVNIFVIKKGKMGMNI